MPGIQISSIATPATIDAPDAADYIRAIELGNAVEAIGYGTAELAYEPAEELATFQNPHMPKWMLGAHLEGELVGRALYETTTGDGADSAWITVQVLPEFRGRGIGTALAEAAEAAAIADGKSKVLVYTPIQDAPGERLTPPTGFGSVPAADRDARFLVARAYLEEVSPGHPSVTTFNAEENRHMLSVNEAIGFEPFAYESAWRKDLS